MVSLKKDITGHVEPRRFKKNMTRRQQLVEYTQRKKMKLDHFHLGRSQMNYVELTPNKLKTKLQVKIIAETSIKNKAGSPQDTRATNTDYKLCTNKTK